MASTPAPNNPNCSDFGDVLDSDDECEVETDAEPRLRYWDHLYCPLSIGEVLNARYRIEHKLGWGGFSTVWLAHDIYENKAVALKVVVPGERGGYERAIQDDIKRNVRDISRLVIYEALFHHPGREGRHYPVFVFPVRGPSLDTTCSRLPPKFRVPAARSLLLALKSLHDAGVVHRDLNSGAVLWSIDPIDQWTTAEKYRRLGRPRKVILTEDQGGPGELVEAIQFPHEMLRHPVSLCDFGLAIRSGTVVENTGQSPPLFCAPERLHRINPSFASDMWSFTCIFAMLYLGIEAIWGEGPTLVSRIIGTVGGPLPAHWKGFYGDGSTAKDWWYDQSGQMPRSSIVGGYETLEEKIDRLRPDICKRERELVLSVMHKGFTCAPERRITAAQLLEDPSFNALMLYYRL